MLAQFTEHLREEIRFVDGILSWVASRSISRDQAAMEDSIKRRLWVLHATLKRLTDPELTSETKAALLEALQGGTETLPGKILHLRGQSTRGGDDPREGEEINPLRPPEELGGGEDKGGGLK